MPSDTPYFRAWPTPNGWRTDWRARAPFYGGRPVPFFGRFALAAQIVRDGSAVYASSAVPGSDQYYGRIVSLTDGITYSVEHETLPGFTVHIPRLLARRQYINATGQSFYQLNIAVSGWLYEIHSATGDPTMVLPYYTWPGLVLYLQTDFQWQNDDDPHDAEQFYITGSPIAEMAALPDWYRNQYKDAWKLQSPLD